MAGKVPSEPHNEMKYFKFLAVLLSLIMLREEGNLHPMSIKPVVVMSVPIRVLIPQCLMQVQWSSLRPTQPPLMCVELVTSPSGVSMMV